jgi:hypothetical protein
VTRLMFVCLVPRGHTCSCIPATFFYSSIISHVLCTVFSLRDKTPISPLHWQSRLFWKQQHWKQQATMVFSYKLNLLTMQCSEKDKIKFTHICSRSSEHSDITLYHTVPLHFTTQCHYTILQSAITLYHTVVLHFTTQWHYTVPHSAITLCHTVVLHCTAQCHYTVPHSAITLYHTVPLPCTTQCYYTVPHSAITLYDTVPLHCTTQCHYTVPTSVITVYHPVPLHNTILIVPAFFNRVGEFRVIKWTATNNDLSATSLFQTSICFTRNVLLP